MIERLSEAEAFLAVNDAFLELSPLGENLTQKAADRHGRKSGLAKPLLTRKSFEQLQGMQEKILGPSMVPRPGQGLCTFSDGTGEFIGFEARVDVSCPGDGVHCTWDGTYGFRPRPPR